MYLQVIVVEKVVDALYHPAGFDINAGDSFTYDARYFVVNCAEFLGNVLNGKVVLPCIAEQGNLVTDIYIIDICNVNHTLVHTNSSYLLCALTVDKHVNLP